MANLSHTAVSQFWSKVDRSGGDSSCWPWMGRKRGGRRREYGGFSHGGGTWQAHRLAYELHHKVSLAGMIARHSCDNPICCNPRHIVPGTIADNMQDAIERGLLRPADQSGERNGNAKLTASDVDMIRRRIARGETNTAIAQDFPVTHAMISKIRVGKFWRSRLDSNQPPFASEANALSK